MKKQEKRNYTIVGKPITEKEFVEFTKKSEKSKIFDFDKGIEIVEERLKQRRKRKEYGTLL